ncbi:MAG: hypothetical protein DRO12_04070 [Thermoprotei archaeon]|nr:MAG: hypothetical protein DRO12_04070 [Thermoprotei archaeon]
MAGIDERKVLTKLVEYLRESLSYEIWHWKNYVLRAKELFPRRPEIDLIICRKEKDAKVPPLFAAEVKYIRSTKTGRVSPSYYSGLDEALALLILGFDKVMLIHLVEEKVLSMVFLDYAKLLSGTIKSLKLPLGYRVYALTLSGDLYIYRTIRLGTGNTYNLEDLWVTPPPNPLLKGNSSLGEIVRRNRRALVNTLGIKDVHPY